MWLPCWDCIPRCRRSIGSESGLFWYPRHPSDGSIPEPPVSSPASEACPCPAQIQGTLVLSFLKHPDLADYAAEYCSRRGVPLIASGPRKIPGAICPITCCGLAKKDTLGRYGQQFGLPEYEITLTNGQITAIQIHRGASCGATWLSLPKLMGCSIEEALEKVAREVQFLCQADPSSFDPITGHSPLHFAGNVHTKALEKALKEAK